MSYREDKVCLHHMFDYATKAVQFTKGKSRVDLDTDELLAMATIHTIEVIGEAAKNISPELRERYPEIPWELIIGTRNRLAHGYIDVDLNVIWTIVTSDLPKLIRQLKKVLDKETG